MLPGAPDSPGWTAYPIRLARLVPEPTRNKAVCEATRRMEAPSKVLPRRIEVPSKTLTSSLEFSTAACIRAMWASEVLGLASTMVPELEGLLGAVIRGTGGGTFSYCIHNNSTWDEILCGGGYHTTNTTNTII